MPDSKKNHLSNFIKNQAQELGFFACGISEAKLLKADSERLRNWLDKGFHAEMSYMENHFDKRTDPRELVENARSVISVLYNYFPQKRLDEKDNYKISKYAYGTDYHHILKQKLFQLIARIKEQNSDASARAFVDSAPVLDRAWAAQSGLGWIGKNTCLINKQQGSFFFIGEIITDLDLDYDIETSPNHCGGCTRCIDACPTGALNPYVLDSNKCISYWTIEHKGEKITEKLKGNFDDWIFGCDICQDVCPWNRLSESHHEPEFDPSGELMKKRKPEWESLTEEQFKKIFKNSPLERTKFKGIKRNIEFVKEGRKRD
ncbi:MAG: tRNA epoxyqueuosine(34) reductase QueG [Bacteroidales bacterium]